VLINLHTHSPTLSPDVLALESLYAGQASPPVSAWRSVGLHPWHLPEPWTSARDWLESEAAKNHTLAIGEAGLDKVCSTPWTWQVEAFEFCIELSEKTSKPLIIHCVRAFSEILHLKKVHQPRQPWIFHGFDKNQSTAQMVLKAGAYMSFGSALFRENSHAPEVLAAMPRGRFFLETDISEWTIQQVYEKAAQIRGWEMDVLEKQIKANFSPLFYLEGTKV
jgi:TatD DNase family protein